MKVFLTGSTGFIGKKLLRYLVGKGCEIIDYGRNADAFGSEFKGSQSIVGDLSNGELLSQVDWDNVDVIIHLAAAGVKASNRVWYDCIHANVIGLQQLLNAVETVSSPPLLFFPTSFYQNYLENHPALQNNPYIVTKASASRLVQLWAKRHPASRVVFATLFQVYGPGDDPGNIVTYTIQQLKGGKKALLGSGSSKRDWVYVDDLIEGIWESIELSLQKSQTSFSQTYDLGRGEVLSIRQIVEKIATLCHADRSLLEFDPSRDRGDSQIEACAKEKVPGWRFHYSIEEGLLECIDAYHL